jgi:diguanylate cyclase (GGDEF)-like protein
MDRLDHALARREPSPSPVAVLFVDLDHFKVVNDTLGHAAGDAVLKATAARLRTSIRPADTAARLGGDEFVIVCEDLTGEDEAIAVAERIEAGLAVPHGAAAGEMVVTASVGIAMADPGADSETLVHRADSAMYDAKQAGRARHCLWR